MQQGYMQPGGAASRAAAAAGAGATDDAAVVDALLKYNYYKQFGMDPRHLAPFREEWMAGVLARVPRSPPALVSQVCVADCSRC